MKKFLLFAFAVSLGGIAFALNNVDCSIEENCHCNFFTQEQYYGIKGCHSCPVRENGQFLKCETLAANGGVIDRDCCWLNTPQRPQNHPWSNCYTNAYVILDPAYGPPWAVRCVQLLNGLVSNGGNGGAGAPNGGTGGNGSTGGSNNGTSHKISHHTIGGGNGGNGGKIVGGNGGPKVGPKVNKTTTKKPAASASATSKTEEKPQANSKKAAK